MDEGRRQPSAAHGFDSVDAIAILNSACDSIIGLDASGRVDAWNASATAVFGWSSEEVLGRDLAELIIPAAHRDAHRRGLRSMVETGRGSVIDRTVELSALRRDGMEFPIELTIWASRGSDGEPRFNGLIRDITARAATQAQLAQQAFYDELTGLPNRALLLDRLAQALVRRRGADEFTAVLMLDLDDFKTVNDSLGHAAGDTLLHEVAQRLSTGLRPVDTLARLAGDEFAMVLQGLADPGEATRVAQRLLATFADPFDLDGHSIYATTSIGIALCRTDESNAVTDLLRDADLAMYAAKRAAGDGYAFYEPHMHLAASRRHELKADLQRAVVRSELVVHYQPIVNVPDGSLAGIEALVRWQHPERGLVPPDEFIPLAEETGLIRAIDDWVLRSACGQLASWGTTHPRLAHLRVNVNMSAHDLADPQLVDHVASALTDAGLPPQYLVLEVTESALAADVESAVRRLSALKSLGVRLALDDFGTGYSSLAYLQTFPFDFIKVDRTFVARLDQVGDPGLAGLVVDIGHGLGLEVTAEGVETVEQFGRLVEMGCDRAQGYLFSRPLPADQVTEHLRKGSPWPLVPAPPAAVVT